MINHYYVARIYVGPVDPGCAFESAPGLICGHPYRDHMQSETPAPATAFATDRRPSANAVGRAIWQRGYAAGYAAGRRDAAQAAIDAARRARREWGP